MSSPEPGLDFGACRDLLAKRLQEPAPGRIQLLTGPRQVGKTTLLLEVAERFRRDALYAAHDSSEAALPGFWERLWSRAEERAGVSGKAVLLLDEIHFVTDWSQRLKSAWDRLRRRKIPVHVVATGSSALRLAAGSRESLTGRFERITLTHWQAKSLVETFGLTPDRAVELVVGAGAYPGAVEYLDDPPRWRAYVREAIVEPAIGRDLMTLVNVRKPALLRQLFSLAASMPAEIVSLQKLQGQLQDRGALETIKHYLALLEEAYLVAPLAKFSRRENRRRAAPPKLVPLSNAFLAVTDPNGVPDRKREPARYGRWVENACLAHARNHGQSVTYWREEPREVDAIVEGSWGSWAIEIKMGEFSVRDLEGLLEFCARHERFRPLVVASSARAGAARRAGIDFVDWQTFLLEGPPGAPSV